MKIDCKRVGKLREKMEELLGVYFYELYDYFLNIAVADYDCKVLIARRCLILYQLFLCLFKADALSGRCEDRRLTQLDECDSNVFSDYATARFYALNERAKILLVDDVAIHGNHAWNVYRQISDILPSADITVRVYMLSDYPNSTSISLDFWRNLVWTEKSQCGEWMELSNRIVEVIYCSSVPYISYLGAYRIFGALDSFTGMTAIDNTNTVQKRMHYRSRVLFFDKALPPFFGRVSALDCLRVYKDESNSDGSCVVIPYCFTRALRKDSIRSFCKSLAALLPESMSYVKSQLLLERKDTPAWDLYRVRLFKSLVSHMLGVYLLKDEAVDREFMSFVLKKSFDEEIARELEGMDYPAVKALLANPCDALEQYFCEDFQEREEFTGFLAETRKNSLDNNIYLDYIWKHRQFEEARLNQSAQAYSGKYPGLSVNYIIRSAGDLNKNRYAAAQVLSLNDSGCATSTNALSVDGKAYAPFLSNGEQSYRVMLERYPLVIRKMIFLEERKQDVGKYLAALFAHYHNTLSKADAEKRIQELTDFYDTCHAELLKLNVTSILEETAYWDLKERERLLQFHQQYFPI